MDPIASAVAMLRNEQARSNDLFEQAIALFDVGPATKGHRRHGPSVRTRLIDLIESEDRSWTTPAALAALEEQGQAVQLTNPGLAVASTLAALVRGRLAVREGRGLYRAAKFSA